MVTTTTTLLFTVTLLSTAAGFTFQYYNPAPRGQTKTSLSSTAIATAWQFRQAIDSDMGVVSDLIDRTSIFHRGFKGKEGVGQLKAKPGHTLGTLFPELPHGRVLLVNEENKDPVGFALYTLKYYGLDHPPSLWLSRLFVYSSERSKGAGAALMQELADIGNSADCSHLSWACEVRNERGLEFYGKMGAEVDSRKDSYFNMKWVPSSWDD